MSETAEWDYVTGIKYSGDHGHATFRLAVPGGWLYRNITTAGETTCVAMVFVPDHAEPMS
jgi:hypothetical protein